MKWDDITARGLTPFSDAERAEIGDAVASGGIRRFGAIINHLRAGYTENALVAWRIAEHDIDSIGHLFSGKAWVSHCYRRATSDRWPYSLYTMIHARQPSELAARLAELTALASGADRIVLKTRREYKKISPCLN